MKTKQIQIDEQTVIEVSELPLIRYAELFKQLDLLPKKVGELGITTTSDFIQKLPLLGSEVWPELIGIISTISGIERQKVEQYGLSTVIKIIEALVEINDYTYLFEMAKKGLARYQQSRK